MLTISNVIVPSDRIHTADTEELNEPADTISNQSIPVDTTHQLKRTFGQYHTEIVPHYHVPSKRKEEKLRETHTIAINLVEKRFDKHTAQLLIQKIPK